MNYKERIFGKQRDCTPGVAITRLGSHMRLAQFASGTNIQVVYMHTRPIVKGVVDFYKDGRLTATGN